jgi:predicted permease
MTSPQYCIIGAKACSEECAATGHKRGCGTKPNNWECVNKITESNKDVSRAVFAYIVVTCAAWLLLFFGFRLRPGGAGVVALIIGQVFMNVIFLPTNIDFFSEFSSSIAIYGLVQLLTPVIVFIYAIVIAVKDRRH